LRYEPRVLRRAVPLLLASWIACDSSTPAPPWPTRDCALVVWHKAQSDAAQVEIVGSWDGWKRPGRLLPAKRMDGWRVTGFDLPPGEVSYAVVEDGKWLLDDSRPTTALHDGIEVSWAKIDDCGSPALRVDALDANADGTAHATLTFLAAKQPLDPGAITTSLPAHVDADPMKGTIALAFGGLAPGKHTAIVTASGASAHLTIWIEPRPFDWRDAPIYQVMVDRYRARDGTALAEPVPMTAFAGGAVEGVRKHLDDIAGMGFRAVWLSPLYRNPDGAFPGEPGKTYSGYHGYWPTDSRALDPRFATEAELDAFVSDAHARGIRVLFDVVPHHVHQQHAYYAENPKAWFEWDGNACTCGDPGCEWALHEQDCWFAPYLPTLDWRNPDVADRITDDVAWWIDRFGGDGVRIDAVPMMPRLAARRIAWKLRTDFDHPGVRTLVLGENFTGPGGYDLLRYELGPFGLDSQFHFPLMWAMRRAIAQEAGPMSDVDAAVQSGEDAWKGSGAVMGLIIGNHDVPRFSSVSAGDADLDGWSPSPQSSDPRVYAKQRLALGLAYTLPGAPVVYYGDEVGLSGRRDPDARRVMPAESALTGDMQGVRDFMMRLAKIRDCSGALRRGTYRTILASDEVLAFAREFASGSESAATTIVVVMRHPLQIPSTIVPTGFVDLLTGRTGTDAMGPLEIAVFQPNDSACLH
jgi:glycosidase